MIDAETATPLDSFKIFKTAIVGFKVCAQENADVLNRMYHTEYELYDERSSDPKNAQVDIYIGVKK
jgi:hypothetical protein